MESRPNTHVRLSIDLLTRLRKVSDQISVPVTRLLDHIVGDALPIYEREAFKAPLVERPAGVHAVPGVNDPRTPAEIAKDAAVEAQHHATEANRQAQQAKTWENYANTQARRGEKPTEVVLDEAADFDTDVARKKTCAHEVIKTLSWGGKVCQECGSVLKRA